MTEYQCSNCGQEIDPNELKQLPGIRCTVCGHRVLVKQRPLIIKRLSTE